MLFMIACGAIGVALLLEQAMNVWARITQRVSEPVRESALSDNPALTVPAPSRATSLPQGYRD